MSEYLKNVEILNGDFEKCVENAKEGDFVFIDSPYAPINPTSFDDYAKEGFEEKDHRRLAELFKSLTEKGCYCMLTNHDTPLIRELYKDYTIEFLKVKTGWKNLWSGTVWGWQGVKCQKKITKK